MTSKVFTGFVVAFWAVMMTALVRMEFFPTPNRLAAVPTEQVIRRLFSNTELQRLEISYQGKRIGNCQLSVSPRLQLDAPESTLTDMNPGAYLVVVHLSLPLQVLGMPSRFVLDSDSWFDRRYELRKYNLRSKVGASRVDIKGDNDTKKLAMLFDMGDGPQEKHLDYAQLKDPAALETLGLPGLTGLAGFAAPAGGSTTSVAPVIHAYQDRLEIEGAQQRVYLVECTSAQNSALWAKIWIDEQGNVLVVETSLGLKIQSGSIASYASRQPAAKTISAPRRLQ